MASASRRWLWQARASVRWLCNTRGALRTNGFPQSNIYHSVGLQGIVERSANLQQKHAPWFDPLHYQLSMESKPKLARLQDVMTRLQYSERDRISYDERKSICMDSTCDSSEKEARRVPRSLDESGHFLILDPHPRQVARAIRALMTRRKELERMEKLKEEIDLEAKRLVRRELWCGLGFMTIQTAGLMRLTFWEMSWDVMEPICFFLTTAYFLAGYAFFLGTSRDPSFEGFFKTRLEARQSRLMKKHNFDLGRFKELRRACGRGSRLDTLEDH